MPAERIRLITRGDDCGAARSANAAIRDAFHDGILRNASVMVPGPTIEEAAQLLARERGLCFGLHCTITAEWDRVRWGPVLPPARVPSLVDDGGRFFQTTRALHERAPALSEVLAELAAQLDRARALGFEISYADQHMGFGWVIPGLDEAFDAWCAREGLRNAAHYGRALPQAATAGDPVTTLLARLDAAVPGQHLIVTHPAYAGKEMCRLGHEGLPGERVSMDRDWDRRLLTDRRMLDYCQAHGVHPILYDEGEPIALRG